MKPDCKRPDPFIQSDAFWGEPPYGFRVYGTIVAFVLVVLLLPVLFVLALRG